MPIYEYKCKKCEKIFDVFQSIGGNSDGLICPACGEGNPQRFFRRLVRLAPLGVFPLAQLDVVRLAHSLEHQCESRRL